ncbi:hypothetical protein HDU96_002939 [Phlyctochytrium bullatum]|nr:hypothetical protein HDU96_002939 [Phlyctochytrium bullatum]
MLDSPLSPPQLQFKDESNSEMVVDVDPTSEHEMEEKGDVSSMNTHELPFEESRQNSETKESVSGTSMTASDMEEAFLDNETWTGYQKGSFITGTFRLLAALLPTVFFIPIFDTMLISVDCDPGRIARNQALYPASFSALNCGNPVRAGAIVATFLAARAGVYTAGTLSGFVATTAAIVSSIAGRSLDYSILAIMECLLIVGFILGYFGTYKLVQYVQETVQTRLETLEKYDNDDLELLVFPLLPHVEVGARFATAKMSSRNRRFNERHYAYLKRVFNRGLHEFPSEPFVRIPQITYSYFLSFTKRELANQLGKGKSLKLPIDLRFQLYCIEQYHSENTEMDMLGAGVKLDVARLSEFRKLDRDAKVNHFSAVQELREIWKHVRQKNFDLDELSVRAYRLFTHAQVAQDSYYKLASKYPRSKLILRFFAKFCHDVTKDLVRSEALILKADEIEAQEAILDGDVLGSGRNLYTGVVINATSMSEVGDRPKAKMRNAANGAASAMRLMNLNEPNDMAYSDADYFRTF